MKDKHFKRAEGVICLPRVMIRSPAYRALSLAPRCLLVELQNRWASGRSAINFSTREAAKALGVSQATATRAFKDLAKAGFIALAVPADHGARKSRGWRLTWNQTPDGREPTDDWDLAEKISRFTTKARNPESESPEKRVHIAATHAERRINDLAPVAIHGRSAK